MDFNEYQRQARRTTNCKLSAKESLSNFGLGLAGEAGETIEQIKKYVYHGHELDRDKIKNELGDILWYLSNIADTLCITLGTVAMFNIEKLQRRYPEGFDPKRSQDREG